MWRWTVSPEKAPDAAEYLDLDFEHGDLVAINGQRMKAHELLATLNQIGFEQSRGLDKVGLDARGRFSGCRRVAAHASR